MPNRTAAVAGQIGPVSPRPDAEGALAEFDAAFAVNVRGGYLLVQLLAPAMLRTGHGSIVNISTMLASNALPGRSVYGASKAAVEALTRACYTSV